MDYPNHITNHEKGKHLSYEDYILIELRLKDGWKAKEALIKSARELADLISASLILCFRPFQKTSPFPAYGAVGLSPCPLRPPPEGKVPLLTKLDRGFLGSFLFRLS